jgi:hypothetical protein
VTPPAPSFRVPPAAYAAAAAGLEGAFLALAGPVLLRFPPTPSPCPNCVFDAFNNTSSGQYLAGGPEPFDAGGCPVCGGRGRLEAESSLLSEAVVSRSPADFRAVKPESLTIPAGHALVKFRAPALDSFLRAQTLLPRPADPGAGRYAPAGEPVDAHKLAPGFFFHMLWRREAP